MDFDPSTAVLDEDPEALDFDPSTAVLDEEEPAFDPSTATLVEEESVSPLKKDGIVDKVMERGAIGAAQGVYGLGRAAHGAISQNLQVLEDVGSAVDKIPGGRAAAALVPGLRGAIELAESDVGESVKQYSQEVADVAGAQISEWQRKGEAVGGGLPGKVSQLVGSAAVSVAPAVVTAPFGGISAAAIAAGMQSFGSTSADAVDAYRGQGLSDEEARNKALIPSVASGIATAAITALGGKSGPEALAGLAKSSGFRRFAIDLLKGAGVEAGEETVDQLMQSAIQKLSFNPELTLDQALEESAIAGGLGFGLGAGFKAVTQVSSPQEVKKEEFKAKIQNTVAQVETLTASGLPQTAAVLAEQDKQKLVLEAVEEATTQPEFLGSLDDEELIRRKEEASPEQARAIDEEINRRTQSENTSESLEGTFDESTAEEIVEPSVDTLTYEYQGFELPISPVEQVPIDSIIKGEQFYQENEETIAEYERKFRAGEPVEPIVVFKTVNGNIVQDGNHRYLGAKRAGVSDVPVTFVDAEANRPITQQGIYFYEFENNPESIERVLQYHERTLQKLAQGETSGAIPPVDTGTAQEIPVSGAGVGQEIPGEVVNGEDFLQTIQSNEPEIQVAAATEQADEITTGTDQPSTPSGAEVQPTGTGVQNSPEIQAELANSLEDLRPQLVKRAQDLGVSDPEAVANDAILRAVKTAKNIAEARKFANSTAIQQSIADTLRKEGAEIRRAQTGAVSLEEEVSEGQTVGDTIQEEVQSPDQEAVQNEQRKIYEDNKNGFYKTLSDEDKLLWHEIHNSGNGRAPSPKKIEELGAKFAAFLKKNGVRDIGGVPKLAVTPPKDWKPTPKAIQDQIKKDYNVAGGLRASLQAIGSKSSNTTRAIIARFLANRMPENIGLLTPNYRAFRPYVGLFGYNGDTPAVLINLSDIESPEIFEETLVHESIHAAVLDLVDVYNISPELLSSNQKKLLDSLNKLFKESQNQLLGGEKGISDFLKSIKEDANFFGSAENRSVYGLVDLGEFVSEAMSNEAFQNQLKAVKVPGTNRNAWKELVSIIKKLLGINLPNTAAEQAFEDIFALIDEGKRFAQSQENVAAGRRQFTKKETLKAAASPRPAPDMEPMGQPRAPTTALERARTGLPEDVSRKLSDQTYVPTTKAEEMAYADRQVDAWKAEGIGYEQMITRILSAPQAFDNLYTARQTAIAARIFRDLGRDMAATPSVLQRQRLADLQYRLANGMASIGSSLGQGLWSFNQIADELAPVTIVKATKEAFKQKQDEMMPQSVKDTAKKVVKEVNEANKKAAGNETVQKKVKETADKVGKVDLSKTADRFLKDIEKKKKARELAAKNKEAAKFQKEGQPNKSKPETLKETYEDSYSRRVASAFINKILGADKTSVPSLELFYEELSKLAQSKLNAQLPKVEEAQKNDARFEEVVGILKNIFNNQAEYDSALTEIKDRVYREARNRGATEETLADIETYLDALQPETLTDSKLQRLLSDSIDFRELVQEHYTNLDEASITLTDKILSRTGMSFADASKIAIRIEKLVQDEAAKAKQSILERLLPKDKKTNKAVRNASQRIIQLSNLGALTEEAYYNAVAEKLKLPSFNKKLSDEIVRQANDIQLMEEGSNKRKLATQKLHSFIAKSAGLHWHNVLQGYWYAAILSGMGTQAFNVVSAALRVQTELAVQAAQTKSVQGFAQAYKGALQGLMRAVSDSAAALKTGDYTGQPAFEATKASRELELITEADPKWMRVLSYGKYISRLMAAADILNAGVAKESRLRLAAYRSSFDGEPNLSLSERTKQIDELLGRTQEKRTEAEFQATEEGLNPGSTVFKRRVMEILDKLAPADYAAESQRYAIEATYNQKPMGILGLMSEAIEKITSKGGGIGKYLIPFTRIVANVTNDQLNYTPIGLGRFAYSAIAKNQDQAKLRMLVSEDATEADIQLFRAKVLIGNSLMIGLAVALAAYDDDDDPALQIIAAGPKDPEKRKQFLAAGGQTYSIKAGDKYLSYLATPMAMSLAMLGSYKDSQRYTNMSDKDALDKFAIAMFGGLGLTLEMSFMRGMANLVEIFSQPFGPELGAKKAVDTILNIPAGLVPNIVKELEQVLQPQVPEKIDSLDNLMSKLPGVRSVMAKNQPQLNMFGEPRKLPLPLIRRFVSEEKEGKAYEIARLLLNQNIAIPVPEKLRKPGTQKEYLDDRQLYKAREIVGKGLKKFLEDNYAELKKDAETNPELAEKKIEQYYGVLRDQAAIQAIK